MPRRIVFIHQNAPGQFKHLLRYCAEHPDFDVAVVGERRRVLANFPSPIPGVRFHVYEMAEVGRDQVPAELWATTNAMRRGRAVALCLQTLRSTGFRPDVVYGHPGWGDMLHVKDVFPEARVVNYCEFYFNREGQDINFDPIFQADAVDAYRVRTDNMVQLASMIDADACISPTQWQRSRYPKRLRDSIAVIHDGIDLEVAKPDSSAHLALGGVTLGRQHDAPVVTYVSRNLEPYRGFHIFMRALPKILDALPGAHVVVVGGDEVSYSKALPTGHTYRAMMLEELKGALDLSRVHFLGRVSYQTYLRVLQVSTVHVYLTYPFVLSWSMLEAMAAGPVVVGSRTAPVQEVIKDGANGLLVDFFDHDELAEAVVRTCVDRSLASSIGHVARATIESHFNLHASCLRRQLATLFPDRNPE